jgi:hypothetical protein
MQRQTYQNLQRNKAQFLSITGFSLTCFDGLFPYFEVQWDKYITRYTISGKERIRPPRTYNNKVFEDTQYFGFAQQPTMLVFILYYLKNNCLQEAHTSTTLSNRAAMFGMNQPQANVWIHLLKRILLKSLKSNKTLPCRDFESLQKYLQSGQDVLIDGWRLVSLPNHGSERPIPRPSDDEVQKEFYSGKKNAHCEKYFHYIHE